MPQLDDAVEGVQRLAGYLRHANRILLFTGAGVSTASGIPDFRGPQGVWKRRAPVYYQDFLSSDAARLEYWEWKLEGWDKHRNAHPNATHQAAAALDRAGKLLALVTQNVDGLHRAAGIPTARLVELHGTDAEIQCQLCGERSPPGPHFDLFRRTRRPPRCACGGWLKPATISFGQSLVQDDLQRAAAAAAACDLAVAMGSTLSVFPAATVPELAARAGAPLIIVNQGPTDFDESPDVELRLEGDIMQLFPPAVALALG